MNEVKGRRMTKKEIREFEEWNSGQEHANDIPAGKGTVKYQSDTETVALKGSEKAPPKKPIVSDFVADRGPSGKRLYPNEDD